MSKKKIALDTYYYISDTLAKTVGVIFNKWSDKEPERIIIDQCTEFGPYIPGQFYKRELPCIMSLLSKIDLNDFDTIILDGYIRVSDNEGLGLHLSRVIQGKTIIGVAKSKFEGAESCEILRGKHGTINPLYVQGLGIDDFSAGMLIKGMYGEFRIPDLLKILDKETKKTATN